MVTSVHPAMFSKQGVSTYLTVCFCVFSLWSMSQKILLPCLDLLMIVPVPLHHSTINGNFTFLLLELILADQVADHPPVVASSGQE